MNAHDFSGRKSGEGTALAEGYEDEDEDIGYYISTMVNRHPEYEEMLELLVTGTDEAASPSEERFSGTSGHEAYLKAYLMTISGLPKPRHFRLFDVVNEDTYNAYEILRGNSKKILDLLEIGDWEDDVWIENILLIDKIEAKKECRGRGMALRLMREVVGIFAKEGTLTILQAMPFGDEVNKGAKDIRRLTDYYLSDSILGFKEIDAEQHPGWLVRYGTQGYGAESECCTFSRYS